MALISPSRRLRRTPFSEGVEAANVKAYTVYNHMLLPTVFEIQRQITTTLKSMFKSGMWPANVRWSCGGRMLAV